MLRRSFAAAAAVRNAGVCRTLHDDERANGVGRPLAADALWLGGASLTGIQMRTHATSCPNRPDCRSKISAGRAQAIEAKTAFSCVSVIYGGKPRDDIHSARVRTIRPYSANMT